MSEWQPIETAPKDGSSFLAIGDDFGNPALGQHYAFAYFSDEHDEFAEVGHDYAKLAYLTHWQPLPAPPALERDTHD